ncbi:hypothetical protein GE107_00735 [Cohnella sp. CFH 77786]|uniref:copper amine oxidase N-terminal domain-containing protein n=1 Tax=Cohnella sp. CFH 77786 TaxID=2662265 RepID=UPI001C60DA72|nr:copper amine oxidase N-terminal domain-containing protein [Cohnella sp. CFH 77786]MBW5444591.1 hypothetical protein [Cohnella sp. CFH 77786]
MERKARKRKLLVLAALLAASLAILPGAALAKNGNGNGNGNGNAQSVPGADSGKEHNNEGKPVDELQATDDSSTSGDSQNAGNKLDPDRKKGLYRALENVKGTPAEKTISDLMASKYGVEDIIDSLDELSGSGNPPEVTGEESVAPDDAELEALADEISEGYEEGKYVVGAEGLTQLADVYDRLDKPAKAVAVQEAAISEEPADLDGYKRLGKLKKKAGQSEKQAFVNGEAVASDVEPILYKGKAMVPFRAIAAALKAEVEYREDGTVIVTRDGVTIELKAGSTTAVVNGKEVQLAVAPMTRHNRIFVPFRFIGEAFGMDVGYEPESGSVIVNDPVDGTDGGASGDGAATGNPTTDGAATGGTATDGTTAGVSTTDGAASSGTTNGTTMDATASGGTTTNGTAADGSSSGTSAGTTPSSTTETPAP